MARPDVTLPALITDHPYFTLWRFEDGVKVPCKKNGRRARPQAEDEPTGLLTFAQAKRASLLGEGDCDGMGIVLREHSNLTLIDIDKLHTEGAWEDPDAGFELLRRLKAIGYCERSPSRRGYHVLVRGALPEGHRTRHRTFYEGKVEVYTRWRFATLTRSEYSYPKHVNKDHSEELAEIFAPLLEADGIDRTSWEDMDDFPEILQDDDVVFEMAGMARRNLTGAETFMRIWRDGLDGEDDASDSVLSAVSSLVTVTKNAHQVARILQGNSGFQSYTDKNGNPKLERWLASELPGIINRRHRNEQEERRRREEIIDDHDYHSRYALVKDDSAYFYDILGDLVLTPTGLNNAYRFRHTGGRGDPLLATLLLEDPDTPRVEGRIWIPKPSWGVPKIEIVHEDRADYVNTWRGYRVTPKPGDISPWLDLLSHLFPDPEQRRNVLQRIAFDVQHPDKKCGWSLVLIGIHGAGKDSLLMPLSRIFGSAQQSIDDQAVKSQYDDEFAGSKIIVVNEVRGLSGSSLEKMKKRCAPENTGLVTLNIKGGKKIKQRALWSVYFLTNYKDAISVTPTERRFYVLNSKKVMPQDLIDRYFEPWLEQDGPAHLLHFLLNEVDLSDFNPAQVPARTEAFEDMVDNAELDSVAAIREAFDNGNFGFNHGLVNPRTVGQAMRVRNFKHCKDQDVRNVLEEMGWVKIHERPAKYVKGKFLSKPRGLYAPESSELHTMRPARLYKEIERITKGADFLDD